MKTTMLCLSSLLVFTLQAQAQEAPPPPGILESHTCNYNKGKDRDDLNAVREFYLKQAAKTGMKPVNTVLWTQVRGSAPYDFIMHRIHESPEAYAATTDAAGASSDMAAVRSRFQSVATCTSNLGAARPIQVRVPPQDQKGPTLVTASLCHLRDGVRNTDLRDLTTHMAEFASSAGAASPSAGYTINPITKGLNSPDVFMLNVYQNNKAWAESQRRLFTSADGQTLLRHFGAVLDCNARGMWRSEQTVAAAE